MEATTIKLHKVTKQALDDLKIKGESYDIVITKLVSKASAKDLQSELIEGYKKVSKERLEILKEWENASREVE